MDARRASAPGALTLAKLGPRGAALAAMAAKIQAEVACTQSGEEGTAGGTVEPEPEPESITDFSGSLALHYLLNVAIFAHLPEKALLKVREAMVEKQFHTGGGIIKKGTHGTSFFMIKSGTVGFSMDESGTKLVGTRGPGESFGEIALKSDRSTTTANAIAQNPVTCYVLSKAAFDGVMEDEVVAHMAATKIQSTYRGRIYRRKITAKLQVAKDKKAKRLTRMAELGIKASEMPNHHEINDACEMLGIDEKARATDHELGARSPPTCLFLFSCLTYQPCIV